MTRIPFTLTRHPAARHGGLVPGRLVVREIFRRFWQVHGAAPALAHCGRRAFVELGKALLASSSPLPDRRRIVVAEFQRHPNLDRVRQVSSFSKLISRLCGRRSAGRSGFTRRPAN
jgi:hypothetical protein